MARRIATFEKSGDGPGAGGLDENSFVRGQPFLRIENFAVGHDVDSALRIAHGVIREFPTRWIPDPNRRGNRFRLLHDATVENRRGPGGLETDHGGGRSRFPRVAILAITGPVRGDVSGIAERKKMEIGRVSEFVNDFEGGCFLSSDSIRIDR